MGLIADISNAHAFTVTWIFSLAGVAKGFDEAAMA